MNPLYRKQSGLSLVELMIAISLSLVLTLGVIQIFSSSKQTSRVQNALARLQENARFALDLLSHDIRMAGQLGCNSNAHITYSTASLSDIGSGLTGYEHADLPAVLITDHNNNPDSSDVVENTDTIVVMHAAATGIPASSDSSTVTASGHGHDSDSTPPLVISDCDNADLFIAGEVNGNDISLASGSSFSKNYDSAKAQLYKLNYHAYYVRISNGRPNLYRTYITDTGNVWSEPLLEGVEDLQILYGEDVNGNGNTIRYVDADTVANMENVTSIRIHLLLSTEEKNLATTDQSYWQQGELVGPNDDNYHANPDNRVYRAFTSTIQIRNQGIGI